jgi:hypothetical protein
VRTLVGEESAAMSLLGQLLAGPANISSHSLLSDPRWEALRQRQDFPALLATAREAESRFSSVTPVRE